MTSRPVWDVHGHYLPEASFDLMVEGQAKVKVEQINGLAESITVNGLPVGATVTQLASIESILAAMDQAGLDRRILTPPPFTYRYWDDPADSLQLCRLLNDALAGLVASQPHRLFGLCTVPLQDPALALGELKRGMDELGLLGLAVGTNVAGSLLSDDSYRSFFRAVAKRGAPVLVHPEFVPSPRYSGYYLVNVLGMPVETGATVAGMIFSGMLEELPDLRVCFVHGGGVAPSLLGRWIHSWKTRSDTRADTTIAPLEQLGSIYWDSLTHSAATLSFLVELVGAEHVVVGTDAPFDMEDATPLASLAAAPRLSEGQISQIQSVTPLRWLYGSDSQDG
ncbi:MAG TPA: amidohydrolase family protein [Acidimicrobiia bacterium]|nr:amidohydrolase family protein [Acidimicrobiia bacterium]